MKQLEGEIEILKSCTHPNVVGYYGTCKKDDELWILMDYCSLGSVKDLMRTCSSSCKLRGIFLQFTQCSHLEC